MTPFHSIKLTKKWVTIVVILFTLGIVLATCLVWRYAPIGKYVTISSDAADRGFYTRFLSRSKIPYQFTETGDIAVPERLLDAVTSNCS